jgi:hypothetical protein
VQESLMIKGLTINLFTVIFMSTNKDLKTWNMTWIFMRHEPWNLHSFCSETDKECFYDRVNNCYFTVQVLNNEFLESHGQYTHTHTHTHTKYICTYIHTYIHTYITYTYIRGTPRDSRESECFSSYSSIATHDRCIFYVWGEWWLKLYDRPKRRLQKVPPRLKVRIAKCWRIKK